jgi:hypothetical protein
MSAKSGTRVTSPKKEELTFRELTARLKIRRIQFAFLYSDIGVLGFDSRWGMGIFLFITASRPALGPIQPPIQWVPALSLGVKRLVREADHSPSSSAEAKNAWS